MIGEKEAYIEGYHTGGEGWTITQARNIASRFRCELRPAFWRGFRDAADAAFSLGGNQDQWNELESPEPELGNPPPARLTIPQAAARLGVSSRRVRALITQGRLTVVEREETPRGPVNWLAAAEVDAFTRLPVGYPKGRPRRAP